MMSEHKNFTKLNWPEIVILIDVALIAFIFIMILLSILYNKKDMP